jgi:hypothetical protein
MPPSSGLAGLVSTIVRVLVVLFLVENLSLGNSMPYALGFHG